MDYVNVVWDTYTNAETFRDVILGPRLLGSLETLQQLTPNMAITRIAERFPRLGRDLHSVYLVGRVRTERGFTQCVRSIHCPELTTAINHPRDMWPANFIWFQWEQLGLSPVSTSDRGFTIRIGGAMGGMDVAHLNQWMLECFGCVLRSERVATSSQLVTSD